MPTDSRLAVADDPLLAPGGSAVTPSARRRALRLAWLGPIVAALVGAALRLWHLGTPDDFVFDETYYAKDALGLVRAGHELAVVPDANDIILAERPDVGSADIFTGAPAYVVHPPVGKWLIGLGELAFGVTPVGWRIAAVIASTLTILILGRVVLRLTGNPLLGTIAAGLLALEGVHLVVGRTALLDGFLMLFVLVAFAALLIDRDDARRRYLATGPPVGMRWWRPWRLAAGVAIGLACGVKWSGLWYLAAFLLLALAWEAGARRSAGARRPWRRAVVRDGLPLVVSLAVVGAAVYLATWTGWLVTDGGWSRQFRSPDGPGLLPQSISALFHYHAEIYRFHVGLDKSHPYMAPAWGWLLQVRPTSFFYNGDGTGCGAGQCAQAVTSVGNPIIWWAGLLALGHQAYRSVFVRDWRSAAVVVGLLAGWAPWLLFPDRTTFTFYSVVFVPFLVAALTLSLGQVLGTRREHARTWRVSLVGLFLLAVVVAAWFYYPVWTGQEIPYEGWRLRMLLPSWI